MKIIKYINVFLAAVLITVSCTKDDIEYGGAVPVNDEAEFQLHYMDPISSVSANYIYKVDLDGKMISNNTMPLQTYNTIPTSVGRFFTSKAGKVNLKLYRLDAKEKLELVYDKEVVLNKGKQNIVVHDLKQPPVVLDNGYPYPYPTDRHPYDTDTIGYVKFYNFMYDAPGVPTTLKLQYQYQYILHPIYTLDDQMKGKIPEGKNVGDLTGDATRSEWLNLGNAVAFGESTGWELVPVKKSSYSAQGDANIYYRIIVTAKNGGIPGVNVVNDGTWQMIRGTSAAYSYTKSLTMGCRIHHFFAGIRSVEPLVDVKEYTAL